MSKVQSTNTNRITVLFRALLSRSVMVLQWSCLPQLPTARFEPLAAACGSPIPCVRSRSRSRPHLLQTLQKSVNPSGSRVTRSLRCRYPGPSVVLAVASGIWQSLAPRAPSLATRSCCGDQEQSKAFGRFRVVPLVITIYTVDDCALYLICFFVDVMFEDSKTLKLKIEN